MMAAFGGETSWTSLSDSTLASFSYEKLNVLYNCEGSLSRFCLQLISYDHPAEDEEYHDPDGGGDGLEGDG